ncbi:DMT family transporter [Hwanghaeella sp.]|uniref:DMT family transporter n=1 Tax=Hwanghaeella sp. TaxID=2605943 RepID=UPI003CCBB0AD
MTALTPAHPQTTSDDNFRGAAFMALSMAGFVCNDAAIKWISGDLTIFQILFLRGLFTILLVGALAYFRNELFFRPTRREAGLILLRVIGEVAGAFCFLTALFNMPLANAWAIMQAMPLTVTFGAALFLGEKVGWRRYTAVFIGFLGVMVIVRPGMEGFNSYALWAVVAVGLISIRDLATRGLPRTVPSLYITLTTGIGVTLAAGLCLPFTEWHPVEIGHLGYLALATCLLTIGYLFGVMAMRQGEIGFVQPFRYTIVIWSTIVGFLVFGDLPDFWTLVGTAIVVGMGFYTFHRERLLAKRAVRAHRSAQETPRS